MLRDFECLLQLQEIDLRIHEQELAKKELPQTVKDLERTIEASRLAMEAAAAKSQDAEKEICALEEQVVQAQVSLDKSQERLNSIKTNREYDAVHAEIENHRSVIQNAEGRRKKLTDDSAQQKARSDAAAEDYQKAKAENEPKIAELRTRIASIDSVIAGIAREREAVVPLINKTYIRTYDLIRKRRKTGRAVSGVNEARICSVCNKVLESQVMAEIRRASKLIMCQSCGSILLWTAKPASPEQKPAA